MSAAAAAASNPFGHGASAAMLPHGGASAYSSANVFTIGDFAPAAADGEGAGAAEPASWAASAGARLAGLRTRAARDPNATLRLAIKAAIAIWALLVFILLCAVASRVGGVARPEARCDDGNACTADLALGGLGGGCVHAPFADGTPCAGDPQAACYVAAASGAPPQCRQGACRGGACLGTCSQNGDCPAISVRSTQTHAQCYWSSCVYVEKARLSVTTTQCDNEVFRGMCEQMLDASDPLRRCLQTTSTCAGTELTCIFTHSCARPVPPKLP